MGKRTKKYYKRDNTVALALIIEPILITSLCFTLTIREVLKNRKTSLIDKKIEFENTDIKYGSDSEELKEKLIKTKTEDFYTEEAKILLKTIKMI